MEHIGRRKNKSLISLLLKFILCLAIIFLPSCSSSTVQEDIAAEDEMSLEEQITARCKYIASLQNRCSLDGSEEDILLVTKLLRAMTNSIYDSLSLTWFPDYSKVYDVEHTAWLYQNINWNEDTDLYDVVWVCADDNNNIAAYTFSSYNIISAKFQDTYTVITEYGKAIQSDVEKQEYELYSEENDFYD